MIKLKILLFDSHKATKKGYPIKIRVTNTKTSKSKYHHLKCYSFEEHWNVIKSEPNSHHPDYKTVLETVLDNKMRILNIKDKTSLVNLSLDQVLEILRGPMIKEDSFSQHANIIIDQHISNRKYKTAEKKQTALNSLEAFNQGEVSFNDISREYIKSYVKWSKNVRGMKNNGIHTYLSAIKSIYNDKMDSTSPFKGNMPKLQKTRSKTITVDLMQAFYHQAKQNINNKPSSVTGAENCIDYFIASFLLGGIDAIDIYELKKEHIVNGRINFMRNKGGTEEWINNIIVPFALDILKKYENQKSVYIFPVNQIKNYKTFYGRYLAKIRQFAERLGSNEYISTKSARYSFINYAKNAGVPREVTAEIVGHATKDVHSIYESGFSNDIKNKYHHIIVRKIGS